MLGTSLDLIDATEEIQPSYFFEASLKQKFLAEGARTQPERQRSPILGTPSPAHRFRTAMAGTALVGAAAAIGVFAFGVIRSDDPGKPDTGGALVSRTRFDQRLQETQVRVNEILQRAATGSVSAADLDQIQVDAAALGALAQEVPLDSQQKERFRDVANTAVTALNVAQEKPELKPRAESAFDNVTHAASAAGVEGVKPLATLAPTKTATPAASATPVEVTPPATPAISATVTSSVAPSTVTPTPPATLAAENPR